MGKLEEALKGIAGYTPDALALEDAQRIIRAMVRPVRTVERVPLRGALGRVLAEDLVSPIDIPAAPNSAMDGWALRSADLNAGGETVLTEVGSAFAGRPFEGQLAAGQCVRIMTGGVVPQGADTVVMQEDVRAQDKRIVIASAPRAGKNVRPAGEDIAKGQVALAAGARMLPAAVGLAASLGFEQLNVYRRVQVAFCSTGDELTPLGEPLTEGQVYDSNRHTLWAMLERLGCETIDLGVVRDDREALEAAFRKGSDADAIVSTGGASEGEADFTRQIAAALGEVAFWKLAFRPGRPFAFGSIGQALFFGLPGNPVAAMVAFYKLVRPALLAMAGCARTEPPLVTATALAPMRKRAGREEYQRGTLERDSQGRLGVRPDSGQGSAMMRSMASAECLIVLPRAVSEVRAGEAVDVILMDCLA